MNSGRLWRGSLGCASAVLLLMVFCATPASAHHLMGGRTPSTFAEGLLSGLGHPIIGPDHFAFLLAIGVAVGVGGLSLTLPLGFIAAMAIGVALHVQGVTLAGAEALVAVSVILAGYLLARGRETPAYIWTVLFAAAGLFHGYAFGEAIFGAERTPLAAYLLGLVAVQGAVTTATALVARRICKTISEPTPRLTGAAIVGVGLTLLISQIVPAA